jgi:hypothetical protein
MPGYLLHQFMQRRAAGAALCASSCGTYPQRANLQWRTSSPKFDAHRMVSGNGCSRVATFHAHENLTCLGLGSEACCSICGVAQNRNHTHGVCLANCTDVSSPCVNTGSDSYPGSAGVLVSGGLQQRPGRFNGAGSVI